MPSRCWRLGAIGPMVSRGAIPRSCALRPVGQSTHPRRARWRWRRAAAGRGARARAYGLIEQSRAHARATLEASPTFCWPTRTDATALQGLLESERVVMVRDAVVVGAPVLRSGHCRSSIRSAGTARPFTLKERRSRQATYKPRRSPPRQPPSGPAARSSIRSASPRAAEETDAAVERFLKEQPSV